MTTTQEHFESWLKRVDAEYVEIFDAAELAKIAWQHQQKRIDELEDTLKLLKPDALCDRSCILSCTMEADAFEIEHKKVAELEKKLAIAVDAMQNLVKVRGRHNTEIAYKRMEEALKQIEVSE